MERDEYTDAVRRVLEGWTNSAIAKLVAAIPIIPATTKEVSLEIFVDQDGEGFLAVQLSLDGPDLYVLNRAVREHAELFETRMTESGLVPPLPLMDPSNEKFSFHDALTDCAAEWISDVWKQSDSSGLEIPVFVCSHDEYGTNLPIQLN